MYFRGKDYNGMDYGFILDGIKENLDIDKFNKPCFQYDQKLEIIDGLRSGVDVDIYANPKFNSNQMRTLRFALEDGLDVKSIAKPEYSDNRIRGLIACIENNYDVSLVDKPEYSDELVYHIGCYVERGMDYSEILNPQLDDEQISAITTASYYDCDFSDILKPEYPGDIMNILIKARCMGVRIVPYIKKGYTMNECFYICHALADNLDVDRFIRYGLEPYDLMNIASFEKHFNTEELLNKGYNIGQLKVLRDAIIEGRENEDFAIWFKPEYSVKQMNRFRDQLRCHNTIFDNDFDSDTDWQLCIANNHGLNLLEYANAGYTGKKLEIIRELLEKGLDITPLLNPEFNEHQLSVIGYGVEKGIDVTVYADPKYNWSNMWSILHLLENERDPKPGKLTFGDVFSEINLNEYEDEQLCVIFWAINKDLDITEYLNPALSATTMKNMYWKTVNNVDKTKFSDEQLEVIRDGVKRDLPMLLYAKPEYSPEQIRILIEAEDRFGSHAYTLSNPILSIQQMYFIYCAFKNKLPAHKISNARLSLEQQRLIYFGILANINTDIYSNPDTPIEEMERLIVTQLVAENVTLEEAIKKANMEHLMGSIPNPNIPFDSMVF